MKLLDDLRGALYTECPSTHDAAHIARWDPARMLRLIVVLREEVDNFSHEGRETAIIIALAEALYGDHPEWRSEWAA